MKKHEVLGAFAKYWPKDVDLPTDPATLRAMQALYANILPPMPTDYPRDYMDAPYQDHDPIKMGWKFGRIIQDMSMKAYKKLLETTED